MTSVLVAMSGGVDSSVAAALLVEAGHDVVGVTLKLHDDPAARGARQGCCTVDDADDARAVAARLGIAHYTLDLSEPFGAKVRDTFVEEYSAGRTPNPCVECNRHIKFTELAARADLLGVECVATGHHARLDGGRLCRAADRAKDQSYVLACLTPDVLGRVLLPVGEMTKADVRAAAAALGLRTAGKAESMEVCFLGPGGARDYLRSRLGAVRGAVVDESGTEVGTHEGAALYTIGQRRGLQVAENRRVYVQSVDVAANEVRVGPAPPTATRLEVTETTWLVEAPETFEAEVQTSAHGLSAPATVRRSNDAAMVDYKTPAPRPAPGQLAAFYEDDRVLGAGTIRTAG